MKNLAEQFDGLNELIYVSDRESYELLFLNKCGLQVFGYDDFRQVKGKKCFEVLQGRTQPCEFCNNHLLSEDSYYEWERDNELADGHFLLKDKLVDWDGSGRLARMEIALDVTKSVREKKRLQETLDREQVVLECIRMMHSSMDVDVAIHNTLQVMGEYLCSERTYIFEIYGSLMDNTFEWCAPGVGPQIDNLKDVPVTEVRRWMDFFEKGESVIIDDLEDIRESDRMEYERLCPQNIHSLVTVPLIENDAVIGFFGVDNPPVKDLENTTAILNILAYFFQSLLSRSRMADRLNQLSFTDGLTGAMNRNAFIRDITPPLADQGLGWGVVFIDVNGLKETNDRYGHVAGDELLIRTYQKICGVFKESSKYRTGGDEFVILCRNLTKEEFLEKAARLKGIFREDSNNIAAIGVKWTQAEHSLQEAVNEAENLMYQDKKSFYSLLFASGGEEQARKRYKTDVLQKETLQGCTLDILEEAQVKQIASQMLYLYFEKQDVEGMLRYMDEACALTDEEHPRVYGRKEAEAYFMKIRKTVAGCRIRDLEQYTRKLAEDTWLCCDWCYLEQPDGKGHLLRRTFKDSKILKKQLNGEFRCCFDHISRMPPGEEGEQTKEEGPGQF